MSHSHGPSPRVWRAALLMAVFVCLFGLLGFRLHTLQVEQHDELRAIGEKQRVRSWTLPANRGAIYDGSGAPIVVSQSGWTLSADPSFMDDRLRATIELARIVPGLDREELRTQFESGKNGRTLAKGLSDDQAKAVRALKLGGLTLNRESLRAWPGGPIASHVVGFVNTDGKGGGGIEQTLDARLAGTPGKETLQVDALGKPVLDASGETTAPIHGANVQLTIEVGVQRELEAALAEAGVKHAPKGAAGIVMRVATGEILAMASWPPYDPTDRATFAPDALNNRAVQLVYEPGSTFKPLIAGAAVAEGLTRFEESIFCERGVFLYRAGRAVRKISDPSASRGGHGNLTVTEGIALSDNILMAKLGLRLGPELLYDWVVKLHFGRKMGICLPGEGAGIVPPKKQWNRFEHCLSVPMGHAVATTPLQLIMAHAAVANRGTWVPPRIVKRVWQDGDAGATELPLAPDAIEPGRVYADSDAAQIEQAMTHTMTEGTGKNIDLDGYIAAGKTGTTKKLVNGGYSDQHHIGSFVCWAPAQPSAPVAEKIICLVAVDDPSKNGYYGGATAGPVVQRVLQYALENARVTKVDKPEPVKKGKKP